MLSRSLLSSVLLKRTSFAVKFQLRVITTKPILTNDMRSNGNKLIIPANSSSRVDKTNSFHVSGPLYTNSTHQKVYTDESGIAAAGYWKTNGGWFIYHWPSVITKANPGNEWMELFAIVLAARLWGPHWNNSNVIINTDSKSTVEAWHHGHFHSKKMEELNLKLRQTAQQHRFSVDLSFIHGDENPADSISRDKKEIFRQRNPSANSSPTSIPHAIVKDLFPH
ncbi:uncharacterized protein [Amphiura filiformis]|uniref:uncharacterized protein n=1 Tax=Amphiura filiformis TaxID=82378 RepID=UPI003B22521C